MVLHVRASRSSAEIVPPVLAAVQAIERDVPMATVHTAADEVDAALVRERLVATLSGVFGLVALALICIGLYGLMAFTVSRRTAEIGIRMALGASRSRVRWLVARQALDHRPGRPGDRRTGGLGDRPARRAAAVLAALRGHGHRSNRDRGCHRRPRARRHGRRLAACAARGADRSGDGVEKRVALARDRY